MFSVNEEMVDKESEIFSILIASKDMSLLCTPGKIEISIEQGVEKEMIEHVLMSIASVDSSLSMELDIYCNYEEIERYAGKGYKIMVYRRIDDKYRVSFSIPFSRDEPLLNLAEDIFRMKEQGGFKRTILWEGDMKKIKRLHEVLSKKGHWEIKEIHYREDLK
jgi:hypothetical protein